MDREKVLLAAEHCIEGGTCRGCPFHGLFTCRTEFARFIIDNFGDTRKDEDILKKAFDTYNKTKRTNEAFSKKLKETATFCNQNKKCNGCPSFVAGDCRVNTKELSKYIDSGFTIFNLTRIRDAQLRKRFEPVLDHNNNLIEERNNFYNLYEKEKKHSENLEKQIEILESQIENPILTRWDAEKPPEKIDRAYILDTAKKMVTGKREQDYGSPEDNFKLIGDMWSAYCGVPIGAMDVAAMMAILKIARIRTGTATDDSWIDLAGYAACGGEIACNDKR